MPALLLLLNSQVWVVWQDNIPGPAKPQDADANGGYWPESRCGEWWNMLLTDQTSALLMKTKADDILYSFNNHIWHAAQWNNETSIIYVAQFHAGSHIAAASIKQWQLAMSVNWQHDPIVQQTTVHPQNWPRHWSIKTLHPLYSIRLGDSCLRCHLLSTMVSAEKEGSLKHHHRANRIIWAFDME